MPRYFLALCQIFITFSETPYDSVCFSCQVIGPNQGDAYLKMKLKDQDKAMQILQESPSLQGLTQIQAPYVDLEVRGLPALQYFGNLVWQDAFKDQKGVCCDIASST